MTIISALLHGIGARHAAAPLSAPFGAGAAIPDQGAVAKPARPCAPMVARGGLRAGGRLRLPSAGQTGWFIAHVPGPHLGGGAVLLDRARLPVLLDQGSILLEVSPRPGDTAEMPLLNLTRGRDVLDLGIDGDMVLRLHQRRGSHTHVIAVPLEPEMAQAARWTISWSWSSPDDLGLLTIEDPDRRRLQQGTSRGPVPVAQRDLVELATGRGAGTIGAQVDWVAMGAQMHPHGPGGCFAPATPILTPQGLIPAGRLQPGDLVETVDAGAQRVLWAGRVALPTLGRFNPVRLCAPHFATHSDLWVLPDQRLAVAGASVRHVLGAQEVLIAAHHMVDGARARRTTRTAVLEWQGILLEGHHLLIADGCAMESLDVSALNDHPAIARRSPLAELQLSGALPRHGASVRRVPTPFEAQTLLRATAGALGPLPGRGAMPETGPERGPETGPERRVAA